MTTSDDNRIAYLAGEDADSLTAQERAELDELRELLGAPATWEQPDAGLEDRVVAMIAREAQGPARERSCAPVGVPPSSGSASSCLCAGRGPRGGCCARHRGVGRRQPSSSPTFCDGGLRNRPHSGRARFGDAHEDELRLAYRAVGNRFASSCERPLLRGVAEERRRRLGACRDVQRRQPCDTVGWGCAHEVPEPYSHPPTGQRQPGLIRRARAHRDPARQALRVAYTATPTCRLGRARRLLPGSQQDLRRRARTV